MKTNQEMLEELTEIEGFDDSFELLEEYAIESVVPGICECGYSTEVEPDQTEGWCEECNTQSVMSCLVLAGVI